MYLQSYMAPLTVGLHINQIRFQRERPREIESISKEGKEAIGSPVNKEERSHDSPGPMNEGKGPSLSHGSPPRSQDN